MCHSMWGRVTGQHSICTQRHWDTRFMTWRLNIMQMEKMHMIWGKNSKEKLYINITTTTTTMVVVVAALEMQKQSDVGTIFYEEGHLCHLHRWEQLFVMSYFFGVDNEDCMVLYIQNTISVLWCYCVNCNICYLCIKYKMKSFYTLLAMVKVILDICSLVLLANNYL